MAANKKAKSFTEEERAEIIRLLDEGLAVAQIARATGLERSRIHNHLRAFGGQRRLYQCRVGEPDGDNYWRALNLREAEAKWAEAMRDAKHQSLHIKRSLVPHTEPMPDGARELAP